MSILPFYCLLTNTEVDGTMTHCVVHSSYIAVNLDNGVNCPMVCNIDPQTCYVIHVRIKYIKIIKIYSSND